MKRLFFIFLLLSLLATICTASDKKSEHTKRKTLPRGVACVECRKSHKGCETKKPCSRCVDLDLECRNANTSRQFHEKTIHPYKNLYADATYWIDIQNFDPAPKSDQHILCPHNFSGNTMSAPTTNKDASLEGPTYKFIEWTNKKPKKRRKRKTNQDKALGNELFPLIEEDLPAQCPL